MHEADEPDTVGDLFDADQLPGEHRALVLGAGGVARALAWAVGKLGINGWCASRSPDNGRPLTEFAFPWMQKVPLAVYR